MSKMMACRPSALLGLSDEYDAWCLDEAVTMIIAGLERGRKLRPRQTRNDNSELLERYFRAQSSNIKVQS